MSLFHIHRLVSVLLLVALCTYEQGSLHAEDGQEYATFKDCLGIKDKAVRFVCYETFAKGQVFSQKKAVVEQKKAFGTGKQTTIDTMQVLTVSIVKLNETAAGSLFFTTSEGQIWKKKSRGRFRKVPVPFEATIKKKLMGGYLLSPVGSKAAVTVSRVK